MKITKVEINNVLSYDECSIELNNDLNIFVGANGSGKSNLLNIIIYILKRYCFKNIELTKNNSMESFGYDKYYLNERTPLYNSTEDLFLKKHIKLVDKPSNISIELKFEETDINNLRIIKSFQNDIEYFLDNNVESINFFETPNHIIKEDVKNIFCVEESDLENSVIKIQVEEKQNKWNIINSDDKPYMKYMKYFSLIYDILNLLKQNHGVKNPFIFFEAYRNNSKETTLISLSNYNNNNYINTQILQNMSNYANSIGTNSTFIMMATRKYGELKRKLLEEENGIEKFENNEEFIELRQFFGKFGYDINLECKSYNENVYQFVLNKSGIKVEIDLISSGEREIVNFIFGLFLEQLKDGIVIIDEPELHLHPGWQRKLINILKEETKNRNIQILFVTHSSCFVTYNVLNNIIRIYKEDGYSKYVKINDIDLENDKVLRKSCTLINATNNEKIFFANYVVLVEGITDEILFKEIYKATNENIPEGLEFVGINGKNNFENYKILLEKLKLPWFYIGDNDNLQEVPELKKLFITDKAKQEKDLKKGKHQSFSCLSLLDSIDNYIKEKNDKNFEILKNNYEAYNDWFKKGKNILSQNEKNSIETYIEREYNNRRFILRNGEIEDYLGTGSSDKTVGYSKVLSFLYDSSLFEEFKKSDGYKELSTITKMIHDEIMRYNESNN